MSTENKPAAQLEDGEALASVKPQELVVDTSLSLTRIAEVQAAADALYAYWLNGNEALVEQALAVEFIDKTLPQGRPQGPQGPAAAAKVFRNAVPDIRIAVLFRIVTAERVVSHLRFTGHFTGLFQGVKGTGQAIDFISIEILQVVGGRITEIRHQEDNLTFMQQIGLVK